MARLCNRGVLINALDPDFPDEPNYTLGEDLGGYDTIFLDGTDDTKVLKYFMAYTDRCKNEANILKKLSDSGFTPRYYGTYSCGEKHKPTYVVMDKIEGSNLLNTMEEFITQEKRTNPSVKKPEMVIHFISQYMDEIYDLYNRLLDLGVIQTDLYLQNIMLSPSGKLYFIDFEFATDVGETVPLEYRVTKEQLMQNLIDRKETNKLNTYLTRVDASGKKSKKKTRKHPRRKNRKTRRTRRTKRRLH